MNTRCLSDPVLPDPIPIGSEAGSSLLILNGMAGSIQNALIIDKDSWMTESTYFTDSDNESSLFF